MEDRGKTPMISAREASEPTWVTAVEWGAVLAFTVIFVDYFVADRLSERGAKGYGCLVTVLPFIVCALAVKEVRDKKSGGKIGFSMAFAVSLFTGLVVATINVVWWLSINPIDPAMSVAEQALVLVVVQTAPLLLFSAIIGLALRRK